MTLFSSRLLLFSVLLGAFSLGSAVTNTELGAQSADSAARAERGQRGGREIERQLQRRIFTMMKERLELSDSQLEQLEAVTVKLEPERRRVRSEEYRLRSALRRQVLAGAAASNDSVARLLDRMPEVERLKIDLMAAEQRELARFLTPIQRARYLALQDEIRRNMDEIRSRRSATDSTSRRRRPPAP